MSAVRPRRRERGQGGAAAVEFALVAPLVLLLLFGIIGYGFMLTFRQALSQGAAEGARSAAVWSASYSPTQEPDRVAAARASVDEGLGRLWVLCCSLLRSPSSPPTTSKRDRAD
jgi:Flp pilus assembly protein TadG